LRAFFSLRSICNFWPEFAEAGVSSFSQAAWP
jgi:hypothetical protein